MQIPDLLLERSKNLKQIRYLKLALLLLLAPLFYFAISNNSKSSSKIVNNDLIPGSGDYVAEIKLEEILFEDSKIDKMLEKVKEDNHAKALILYINSPGGSSVGGEKIYSQILKIKEKKPVVAVLGTIAASGGYMSAVGADYIIAHHTTLTGSIGVIIQSAEISELANKLGVKFKNFKSSPLKAAPNPTETITHEVEKAMMEVVNDTYDYFVDLVAKNRKLTKEEVLKIADGRVFTGRQAVELKLIDALGTEDDALIWLTQNKNINPKIKIKTINPKPRNELLNLIFEELNIPSSYITESLRTKLMAIYQ